jgi:metallo-beta-lactamase family protein
LQDERAKENAMNGTLTFLGGVGTVTGSKYLLEAAGRRVLIDCGLFQGFKQLRLRNWAPFPVEPRSIDAVLLTHAHLDHSGYLPLLVRNGFAGPVVATAATEELCGLLLPDSGFLQEKDAEYANRAGFSRHHPALPLYTERDARRALERFRPVDFDQPHRLFDGITATWRRAGHILGAASVHLKLGDRQLVFSGDIGRPHDTTMLPPETLGEADWLVVESTYGDRQHDRTDPEDVLARVINGTVRRGGTVLVPAFAVGRAQALLVLLHRLQASGRIGRVPVFLDSPMAIDATGIFCRYSQDHRLSAQDCRDAFAGAHFVETADASRALQANRMPKILVSASGMATGGRVLHHLKYLAPDHRNTILFTGFQAGGTRGASLVGGAQTLKIHGEQIPVRAEVRNLDMLSAHADAGEIIDWLRTAPRPPRTTFVTHGEPAASDGLRQRIESELGWPCTVPEQGATILLS